MGKLAKLKVKVVPGASCTELSGWLGDLLKIRIAAQPEKGKANKAIIALLSDELQLPKNAFAIISGTTSPQKVIEIKGLDDDGLYKKLALK